jgi:hypothetical protein
MSDWAFLNKHRVRLGPFASHEGYGCNGAFEFFVESTRVRCIASDGLGWKHVSVSMPENQKSTPRWSVMCAVKDLFWEPEDVVVQFHPRKSEYVNHHPGCLHLWQSLDQPFPTPDPIMVGPKT